MPAKPPHNRKLGLLGVSLTKARLNPLSGKALDHVRDELERIMVEAGYLNGAPFSWVTVSVRYGLRMDEEPKYQRINKRYGDLPLAIEVDTHLLRDASLDDLKAIFKLAVVKCLIHAGRRYSRPTDRLEAELTRMIEASR
jgi:hypothetical protein